MYHFQKVISNALVAACLLPFGGAVAQQVEDHWWIPNNTVHAIARDSVTGTVYLGGDFTTVAAPVRYGAALDPISGMPEVTWAKPNAPVYEAIPDGSGGWFIGGAFTQVGSSARVGVARLNSDGTVHPFVCGITGQVIDMALSNDTLYLGGTFISTVINTQRNVMAVNANTGVPYAMFQGGVNNAVRALEKAGTTVFAGGDFTYPNGDGPFLSQMDKTSLVADWSFVKPNGQVLCAVADGAGGWYIGGGFSQVGGVARSNAARINADGTLHPWNPNVITSGSASVSAIELVGSTVYLGGAFTSVGGQARGCLAAVDATTAAVLPFFNNMAASLGNGFGVNDLQANGGELIVGGRFPYVGSPEPYGTKLDATTGVPDFNYLSPNGTVNAAIPDGSGGWYVGGSFSQIGGVARVFLARINSDGTLNPWNPGASGSFAAVHALLLDGTTLYVGGSFTTLGGQPRRLVGAVSTVTGLATSFNANNIAGTVVLSITKDGSTLYIGGSFTDMGGSPRQNLAAVDANTGVAIANWRYAVNNTVRAITTTGGQAFAGGDFTQTGLDRPFGTAVDPVTGAPDFSYLEPNGLISTCIPDGSGGWFIGGDFTQLGTATRNRIARLNADGSVNAWNPNSNGGVRAMVLLGSNLYVGGSFFTIGGQTRNRLAALDVTTGLATAWNPNVDQAVLSMATDGTVIYAGGQFTTVGTPALAQPFLVALDPVTGLRVSDLGANAQVNTLKAEGTSMYVGGAYTTLVRAAGYAVSTNNISGSIDFSNARPNGVVMCSAPDGAGGWYIGGFFTQVGGVVRNRLARINADGTLNAWNPNAGGTVRSMTVSGGLVYVGGDFFTINGVGRTRIAAIDGTTGVPTAWNPIASDEVLAIEVEGSVVYAGGRFFTIGGQPRSGIAALDITTGLATAWNPGVAGSSNFVLDLELSGAGTIYVAGEFFFCAGVSRPRAAEVDLTTGVATAFNPGGLSGTVNVVKIFDAGSLFLGGGQGAGISKRDRSTGAALSWNALLNSSSVLCIAVDGSTVYVGGQFTSAGGSTRNRGAAFDGTTAALLAWDPSLNNYPRTFTLAGSKVLVGGEFTQGSLITRNRLAEVVASTSAVTSWNPNMDNTLWSLEANGTTVYAGGDFSQVNGGTARLAIAALDRTTGLATSWNPGAGNRVTALKLNGATSIFVGGYFNTIAGSSRGLIAELDLVTGLATAWDPSADYSGSTLIATIGYDGTRVYIGGAYTFLKPATRNRLGAFDVATGDLTAWNPNSSSVVYALAASGSNIYAGGAFTTVGGQPRNRIAALDATTGLATVWYPNADGEVYGLLIDGSTVYAGGAFLNMGGLERARLAAIDITTGIPTPWDPSADYHVRCIAKQGSGVYVGGDFTLIGGKMRSGLFAIDMTTSVITAWDPRVSAGNSINTMFMDGGLLYVGGFFGAIKGVTKQSIAAVDLVTGVPTAWAPTCNLAVFGMQKLGSTVFVGGSFTSLGGQGRNFLGGVDAITGLATAWNPAPNNQVSGLTLDGTDLYVGGTFTTIQATARNRAAAINTSGFTLLPWAPGADGEVADITFSGSKALLTGAFTNIGGPQRLRLASWNTTTGVLNAFDPAPNNLVHDLKWDNGTLYCAGQFSILAATTRNNIGALNATTGALTSWNPSSSGSVYKLGISGSSLYAGGLFFSIGGQSRSRVAEVSLVTGLASSWNPTVSGGASTVNDLYVSPTSVFVSGNFTTIAGQPRNHLAAIDRTTGAATSWNPTPNAQCFGITGDGVHVYVGGDFTTIGQQTRNRICALDANGNLTAWNPGADNSVRSLALDANSVYAGGLFTNIGGQARNRIAAINKATGLATGWNPNANGSEVAALAVLGSTVYAGGDFSTIGGQTRNRIAALDASTGLATAWNPISSNTVRAILPTATVVYASGFFATIGGQTRNRIAALDPTTGLATAWNPNANNAVLGMSLSGGTLYAAGIFTTIGGQTRNRIAALDVTTGLVSTWNPNADNSMNAVDDFGSTVIAGGNFSNVGGNARARLSVVDATSGSSSAWNVGSITGTGVNAVVTDGLRVYSGGNFTAFGGTTHNYFGVAALCPTPSTFYRDLDGDTYGDPNASLQLCEQVAGVVTNSNDCDDTDPIKWVSAPCDDANACTSPDTYDVGCTCVGVPLPDTDGDLTCDALDGCLLDPLKIAPGQCGCGNLDTDTDGDLTADCNDLCPLDPLKIAPGACGCGAVDTDTDGDLVADCIDTCPLIPGQIGTACDDGDAYTSSDQLNGSCICQGTCPGTTLALDLTTDNNASQTSWEIIPQGGGAPLATGSGYANLSNVILDQCLPAGCYFLRVLDSGGNGMGSGGYVLSVQGGGRIIDNAGDGVFTSVSQIAGVNGFCLPIGTDQVVPWRCDVETWLPSDFIQVQPNPLVSAQYGTGNQTDDGYQWWFFNPDGGYTRRIFVSHANASYQFPVGAARCSYLRFSDLVTLPLPQDVLLNVRVRSRVNGTYAEFGPACRLKIDVAGQCPLTQLVNDINSPYHSCGITNVVLNGSKRLYAQYISGANKYQFEFDDINSSYLRTIASTSTSLLLQPWATLPLQYGKTYNVRVRASFDNGASYCPWGLVCTITTAAAPPVASRTMEEPMMQLGSTELLLWPNPNQGDKLNLSLTGMDDYEGPAYLEVLDLLGRPVLRHALVVAHSDLNAVVELDGTMGTGVYLVQLTVGERVFTQRLVIN